MEHINRIELQGRIGNVRTNVVGENKVANFSLVTEHLYKTRDGGAVNETTWHYVVAWNGRDIPDMDLITKGRAVNVVGRLRASKYTTADGTEKHMYEVVASRLRLLDEADVSQPPAE
ncbi:MAG: single-stranded DNA-binding protein [Bacteroidales bacterium]|nr:single-stranded DNA-binding protein [Bacteroidales bacterium]